MVKIRIEQVAAPSGASPGDILVSDGPGGFVPSSSLTTGITIPDFTQSSTAANGAIGYVSNFQGDHIEITNAGIKRDLRYPAPTATPRYGTVAKFLTDQYSTTTTTEQLGNSINGFTSGVLFVSNKISPGAPGIALVMAESQLSYNSLTNRTIVVHWKAELLKNGVPVAKQDFSFLHGNARSSATYAVTWVGNVQTTDLFNVRVGPRGSVPSDTVAAWNPAFSITVVLLAES